MEIEVFEKSRHVGRLSQVKREIQPEMQIGVDVALRRRAGVAEQRPKWVHDCDLTPDHINHWGSTFLTFSVCWTNLPPHTKDRRLDVPANPQLYWFHKDFRFGNNKVGTVWKELEMEQGMPAKVFLNGDKRNKHIFQINYTKIYQVFK